MKVLYNLCYMVFFYAKEVKKLKKWLYRALITIFIISLIVSIIYIIKNAKEDKEQQEIFEELENIITEENEEQ